MSENWDLVKSVDHLRHQEPYQYLIGEVQGYLQDALDELQTCEAENMPRLAGKIGAFRDLLEVLDPPVGTPML
jgi:hypothetical protein